MGGAGKLKNYVIVHPYFVSSVASKLFKVKGYVLFTVKFPASAAVHCHIGFGVVNICEAN